MLRRGNLTGDEIESLVDFACRYGGVDYSYSYMRNLQEEAGRLLHTYPESEWRDSFSQLFDFIITRTK